jgi:hypothetical protein
MCVHFVVMCVYSAEGVASAVVGQVHAAVSEEEAAVVNSAERATVGSLTVVAWLAEEAAVADSVCACNWDICVCVCGCMRARVCVPMYVYCDSTLCFIRSTYGPSFSCVMCV